MNKEPQTIAGGYWWLARGLGKSFSYLLHFATNVSLWIGVGLVASQQPPSRVFVLVVVGLTLPFHLLIPVPFGFSAQRSTSAAKVMRAYIRNLKVAAVFLTVVVTILIIIAPLVSSGEPVIPAGSWIAMVLAHWISLLLMDVLHPAPTLPPWRDDDRWPQDEDVTEGQADFDVDPATFPGAEFLDAEGADPEEMRDASALVFDDEGNLKGWLKPHNPPNKTDQTDSDSDDEAGAK